MQRQICTKTFENSKIIPLVFAVDDNYAPFLGVTLKSIIENSSKDFLYKIYVLNTGLTSRNVKRISALAVDNFEIKYIDVNNELRKIRDRLFIRDYYTDTTYYRFFIPELFPEYDKVLYLDSDIVVLDDIAKLYNTDIGDNLLGAVQEEVMANIEVFGNYVEEGLGIACKNYFNAGVALLNLKELRSFNILQKFLAMIDKYKFEVTQDQDYLNVLCQDRVTMIELGWNKTPFKDVCFDERKIKLIHYKLSFKPWLYDDVTYADYFWKYAEKTSFYREILNIKLAYTDENRERDSIAYKNLMQLALDYTLSENNYKRLTEKFL